MQTEGTQQLFCCWLLAVCCWLFVVGCLVFCFCCWLLVIGCWLLVVCCVLFVAAFGRQGGVKCTKSGYILGDIFINNASKHLCKNQCRTNIGFYMKLLNLEKSKCQDIAKLRKSNARVSKKWAKGHLK